jgi:putative DNA primase/helicase
MRAELRDQCAGRWVSVLVSIGMEERLFSGKHGPCLYCGGKDRARWIKAKEFYLCNQCGSHTPSELAMHTLGRPFKETASEIRKIIGGVKMEVVKTADESTKNKERLQKILKELKPINGDCPASRYLANRGLRVLPEKDLYFHPEIAYWQDGVKTAHPAMVAIFRNLDGHGSTMHITYLTPDGKKADVEAPRKILPVALPLSGCAIQLFVPGKILAVAEGIETALAVHQIDNFPVWACGNAAQMESLEVPEETKTLYIYADEDDNFTGAKAAYTLAKRMKAKGKEVTVVRLFNRRPFLDGGDHFDFLDFCVLDNLERSGRNAQKSRTG